MDLRQGQSKPQPSETRVFGGYLVNGVAAAGIYFCVSVGLSTLTALPVLGIIVISYVVTSSLHFLGSHWVFRRPLRYFTGSLLARYALAVFFNFALNMLMGWIIYSLSESRTLAAVLAPVVPTIVNFPILKYLVFQDRRPRRVKNGGSAPS